MQLIKTTLYLGLVFFSVACGKKQKQTMTQTKQDAKGYTYKTVENDPTAARIYTLKNGLTVYLSKNTDAPKIQTYIAVRAGSVYDPKDNTGLAHYLEHMLFKGTDKIGTQDYAKEKVYLERISDLYEAHKKEQDPTKKREIYKQIDSVSLKASAFSIANEYDKITSAIGAENTNAHTWHEETVYKNKIPSNQLEKWLTLESERFNKLVLRLFHTELEAVYEEFNRAQDSDYRKVNYELMDGLFPTHPYGQQTTLGTSEHLKNPSMQAIHAYFDKYYVPNNMAIVLVGDLDFEDAITKVDASFGSFKSKEVLPVKRPIEKPLHAIVKRKVTGPEAASLTMAYRTPGIGSDAEKKLVLIDMLLSNSTAGLIDLHLNQKQKVQKAGSYTTFLNDYGIFSLYATPKKGQQLQEVEELLVSQIQKIKDGAFDNWMLPAIINDIRLEKLKDYEDATSVATAYYNAFVHFIDWEEEVGFIDDLQKITKEDLVAFANTFFKDNYVVVYKEKGKSDDLIKVENPKITPVALNRDKQSVFMQDLLAVKAPAILPKFIDYNKAISTHATDTGIGVSHVANTTNALSSLYYIFDFGTDADKNIAHAMAYAMDLGTPTYSPTALRKEFYKLGIKYEFLTDTNKSLIHLSGLEQNMPKGIALLTHFWESITPEQKAYTNYLAKIAKKKQNKMQDKRAILWEGLYNYSKYGANSAFRNAHTAKTLAATTPQELTTYFKDLKNKQHRIFYYGSDLNPILKALNTHHKTEKTVAPAAKKTPYIKQDTGNDIYFTHYDMVQAELLFLAKASSFSADKIAATRLFNAYFGSGLSSIVFQEIRESKSLAYSAFSVYRNASFNTDPDYMYAYVGTQANKLQQATNAMLTLLKDMPKAQEQFDSAKAAVLKQIEAERITKEAVFWNYERLKKQGILNDNRSQIYNAVQKMTLQDVLAFFDTEVKDLSFDLLLIGNKKDMDFNALKKLGTLTELSKEYLFNEQKQ